MIAGQPLLKNVLGKRKESADTYGLFFSHPKIGWCSVERLDTGIWIVEFVGNCYAVQQ